MSIIKDRLQTTPKPHKTGILKKAVVTLAICVSIAASALGMVGCVGTTPGPDITPGPSATQPLPTSGQHKVIKDTCNLPASIQADSSLSPMADENFGQFYRRVNCTVFDSIYHNTFGREGRKGDADSMYSDLQFAYPSYIDGVYETTVFVYDFYLDLSYYSSIKVQLSQSNRALVDQAFIDGDIATAITYLTHISKCVTLDPRDVITMDSFTAMSFVADALDTVSDLEYDPKNTIYRDGTFYILGVNDSSEFMIPVQTDFDYDANGVVTAVNGFKPDLNNIIIVSGDLLHPFTLLKYMSKYDSQLPLQMA